LFNQSKFTNGAVFYGNTNSTTGSNNFNQSHNLNSSVRNLLHNNSNNNLNNTRKTPQANNSRSNYNNTSAYFNETDSNSFSLFQMQNNSFNNNTTIDRDRDRDREQSNKSKIKSKNFTHQMNLNISAISAATRERQALSSSKYKPMIVPPANHQEKVKNLNNNNNSSFTDRSSRERESQEQLSVSNNLVKKHQKSKYTGKENDGYEGVSEGRQQSLNNLNKSILSTTSGITGSAPKSRSSNHLSASTSVHQRNMTSSKPRSITNQSNKSKSDCLSPNGKYFLSFNLYFRFCFLFVLFEIVEALQLYGDKLNEYEKQEINEYNEIYFVGLDANKINATSVKDYDDEHGTYIKMNKDHVAYRYEIIETLGKGSFGQVLKCFDHKKKEHVAVKIIRSKKR
jgi:hypothetical protein